MKRKTIFLIVLLILLILSCSAEEDNKEENNIHRILGVWNEWEGGKPLGRHRFSWGLGSYFINTSILIDYDSESNGVILEIQGFAHYRVVSLDKTSENHYLLHLEKIRSSSGFPEKLFSKVIFLDSDTIILEELVYQKIFRCYGDKPILYRIAGPDFPYSK